MMAVDQAMTSQNEPDAQSVVYQPRCVNCKREQYALNVASVSRGDSGCCWCGFIPPVFVDEQDYRDALWGKRANGD